MNSGQPVWTYKQTDLQKWRQQFTRRQTNVLVPLSFVGRVDSVNWRNVTAFPCKIMTQPVHAWVWGLSPSLAPKPAWDNLVVGAILWRKPSVLWISRPKTDYKQCSLYTLHFSTLGLNGKSLSEPNLLATPQKYSIYNIGALVATLAMWLHLINCHFIIIT